MLNIQGWLATLTRASITTSLLALLLLSSLLRLLLLEFRVHMCTGLPDSLLSLLLIRYQFLSSFLSLLPLLLFLLSSVSGKQGGQSVVRVESEVREEEEGEYRQ